MDERRERADWGSEPRDADSAKGRPAEIANGTISGHFSLSEGVSFGPIPAAFFIVSETSITAITPYSDSPWMTCLSSRCDLDSTASDEPIILEGKEEEGSEGDAPTSD